MKLPALRSTASGTTWTLVVGPTSVKAVRILRSGKTEECSAEFDGTGLGEAIGQLREGLELQPGALVHVVIRRPLAWTKVVSLPAARGQSYAALLNLNAHRFLPVAMDRAVISGRPLGGMADEGTRPVLVSGADRSIVEQVESSLKEHGFTLGHVMPAPAAMYLGMKSGAVASPDETSEPEADRGAASPPQDQPADAKQHGAEILVLDSKLCPRMFLPDIASAAFETNSTTSLVESLREGLGSDPSEFQAVRLTPGRPAGVVSRALSSLGIAVRESLPGEHTDNPELALCVIGAGCREARNLTLRSAHRTENDRQIHRWRRITSIAASLLLILISVAARRSDTRRELHALERARSVIAADVLVASAAVSTVENFEALIAELQEIEIRQGRAQAAIAYLAAELPESAYLSWLEVSGDTVRISGSTGLDASPWAGLESSGALLDTELATGADGRRQFAATLLLGPARPDPEVLP